VDDAERIRIWPDWLVASEQVGNLAGYVDPDRARDLVPTDCLDRWSRPSQGEARARRLYDALRDRRIPYALHPWNPAQPRLGNAEPGHDGVNPDYQRIRSQLETIQGPATCLDLAIVYAGMALAADMRPLIAVRTSPTRHALVLIDTSMAQSMQVQKRIAGPPGFTERPDKPNVWHRAPGGVTTGAAGDWLAVDIARVARRLRPATVRLADGASFDEAISTTSARDVLGGSTGEWTSVDLSQPHPLYTPHVGRSIPAIHGYLPAFPGFLDYPSRAGLLKDLHDRIGPEQPPAVIVLQGDSGRGKSMLAHRLALAADHGCGWFLNATDRQMLTRSLSQAENQEQAQRDERPDLDITAEKPDGGDDQAFASAALRRLRDAERPWVVVLDNCDRNPESGVLDRMPVPHSPGQFVIITTTEPVWLEQAVDRGWTSQQLPGLNAQDLTWLNLPVNLAGVIGGRPLIAQVLAGVERQPDQDVTDLSHEQGPKLAWDLARNLLGDSPKLMTLARLLAWCPPEAISEAILLPLAGLEPGSADARLLTKIRLVDPSWAAGVSALAMHRLFAATIREQTWHDDPDAAAGIISQLMSSEVGRGIFIDAADTTAFARLEPDGKTRRTGQVADAAARMQSRDARGLLWYALGHIRERRGPVKVSGPYFATAADLLDPDRTPYEVAECLIGQARIVFQNRGRHSDDDRAAARARVEQARSLLVSLSHKEALQLREQGNALSWLLAQQIASNIADPRAREQALGEVRENLWLSYETRLRIMRGSGREIGRTDLPEPRDGLGPERAFYNLAGVNIQLAKTHRRLAVRQAEGSAARGDLQQKVARDLNEAARVYETVRILRELRYRGRPHPHLAACVQGQAYVPYFRAVLLEEGGYLVDAFRFAAEAFEQRRAIAEGLTGLRDPAILADGDVIKALDFMLKVTVAGICSRSANAAGSWITLNGLLGDALKEIYD
jgi:hypothetical protein